MKFSVSDQSGTSYETSYDTSYETSYDTSHEIISGRHRSVTD
jgi:hypothetical protein